MNIACSSRKNIPHLFALFASVIVISCCVLIWSADAALPNNSQFDLGVSCGDAPPNGPLQYSGSFHREVAGRYFDSGSHKWRTQKRYAILKGKSCWIEFAVPAPPYPTWRSTGKFSEVYESSQLLPASDDMGELITIPSSSLEELLLHISPVAAECNKKFASYRKSFAGSDYGRNYSREELRAYQSAVDRLSKCMRSEISKLDRNGFVGVRFDGKSRRGFAWLSGKLYQFDLVTTGEEYIVE